MSEGVCEGFDFVFCASVAKQLVFTDPRNRSGFLRSRAAAGTTVSFADFAQQVSSNDDALNFIGTFVDCRDLSIAVSTFDVHAFQEAGAAEDLKGFVGDFDGRIRSVHLSHSRFHAVRFVFFF